MLADGKRLHLQHGPIDLIVEADGAAAEVAAAYAQARQAFGSVLGDLVEELALLRSPVTPHSAVPRGEVAARMHAACLPHCAGFITPMAAVAGAVADHVLANMLAGRRLRRAYVNDGGDIAIHLDEGQSFRLALCDDPQTGSVLGHATIRASDPVRGIATSGWRGRSFSFGVADAATVLARDAAAADAAATLIANAADPGKDATVLRRPACELAPDSDLGEREVTVSVGRLTRRQARLAAERAGEAARCLAEQGLIAAALVAVQGEIATAGDLRLETDAHRSRTGGWTGKEDAA